MLTKDELTNRRNSIGASDVGAILGVNPNRSAYKVYREKVGEEDGFESNDQMDFGSYVEGYIIGKWNTANPSNFAVKNEKTFYHREYPFISATPDTAHIADQLIELKNVHPTVIKMSDEWDLEYRKFPHTYYAQMAQQALVYSSAVLPINKVILLACVQGTIHQFEYERNEKVEKIIVDANKDFWYKVEHKIEPTVTKYSDAIKKFFECAETKKIVSFEEQEIVIETKKLSQKIKKLEEKHDQMKARVGEIFGANDTLLDNKGKQIATWKKQDSSRVDVTRMKEEQPKLYKKYLVTSSTRSMRFK